MPEPIKHPDIPPPALQLDAPFTPNDVEIAYSPLESVGVNFMRFVEGALDDSDSDEAHYVRNPGTERDLIEPDDIRLSVYDVYNGRTSDSRVYVLDATNEQVVTHKFTLFMTYDNLPSVDIEGEGESVVGSFSLSYELDGTDVLHVEFPNDEVDPKEVAMLERTIGKFEMMRDDFSRVTAP